MKSGWKAILNTALFSAALVSSSAQALADGNKNFNGEPVQLQTVQLHIQGKPITVDQIVLELHEMNVHGSQPVGLWIYFYVSPDAANGNAEVCEKWFKQVLTDRAEPTSEPTTTPWLEIQVSSGAQPVITDEGYELIPDSQISCWEALELKTKI